MGRYYSDYSTVILIFGKLIKGIGKVAKNFGKFGKSVKESGSVMKVIMTPANKIVLIVTAIALVAFLVIKYWEPIKAFFKAVFEKIKEILRNCGVDFEKLKEAWEKTKEAIGLAIEGLWACFVWLWELIKPWVDALIEVFKIFFEGIIGYFEGAMTGLGDIINGVVDVFTGLIDFITGVFTGDWERAWEGIVSIFTGIFEGIGGACKSVMNGVIGFINGAIRGLNKLNIKMPDWLGGHEFGFNIPEIPMLYKGTDNWKGGTAMIHDRGAEIVDLPRGTRVYPHDESIKKAFNDGRNSSSGFSIAKLADTIVVREDADIERIANALYRKFKKHALNMA